MKMIQMNIFDYINDEYYDFFFENIVVSDSNSQELINKYINNNKKGE